MNKVDELIDNFIQEAILFFYTNLLIVVCPKKFSRISFVRSKRKHFLIQNKYFFFFLSCFIFFIIQTILNINLKDIYSYIFTDRVYSIEYKEFLNHIRTSIDKYKFNFTDIFFFIFPIGFIPLFISWLVCKFNYSRGKHYNYFVYLLSFQINTVSFSILIFAFAYFVWNSPFTVVPQIISITIFTCLNIYIFIAYWISNVTTRANESTKIVFIKKTIIIVLIFSSIVLILQSLYFKNRISDFLKKDIKKYPNIEVIKTEGSYVTLDNNGEQNKLCLSLIVFNDTSKNLIIENSNAGSIDYKFKDKNYTFLLQIGNQSGTNPTTKIELNNSQGFLMCKILSNAEFKTIGIFIDFQNKNKEMLRLIPAELMIKLRTYSGSKLNVKKNIGYLIYRKNGEFISNELPKSENNHR